VKISPSAGHAGLLRDERRVTTRAVSKPAGTELSTWHFLLAAHPVLHITSLLPTVSLFLPTSYWLPYNTPLILPAYIYPHPLLQHHLLHPEDEGSKVIQNVGILTHHYMVSKTKRPLHMDDRIPSGHRKVNTSSEQILRRPRTR
jgi:hypothetical protein